MRTMNVTRSRSLSLIFPAATSQSSRMAIAAKSWLSAEPPGLENRFESSKTRLRHSGFSGAVETALHSAQSQGPSCRAQHCRLNVRFARTEACRLH